MNRGPLCEQRGEIECGKLLRCQRSGSLLQHVRPGERLLHRDLLVDREAHQQCERILGEQPARLVVVREPERVGHARILRGQLRWTPIAIDPIQLVPLCFTASIERLPPLTKIESCALRVSRFGRDE